MNPLLSLLQLTLYGLKLSEIEFERLFVAQPKTWEGVRACLEAPSTLEKLKDELWCANVWRKIDGWTKAHDLQWTYPGHFNFPAKLLQTSDPPWILCFRGLPVWREHALVSVVGSREPMRDSIDWMRTHLLGLLQEFDVSVASGGARGVDAAAHEMSLLAGRPTVCFLPSGLLEAYPKKNRRLFERIVQEGGALVSGFAPDAEMRKQFFHQRNRWIAGISDVTFIVEAQRKSGSLLTARMALEEGRSLCTLPLSPQAHQGLGNLDLLNDGAQILRDQKDLEVFLRQELGCGAAQSFEADPQEEDIHEPERDPNG